MTLREHEIPADDYGENGEEQSREVTNGLGAVLFLIRVPSRRGHPLCALGTGPGLGAVLCLPPSLLLRHHSVPPQLREQNHSQCEYGDPNHKEFDPLQRIPRPRLIRHRPSPSGGERGSSPR